MRVERDIVKTACVVVVMVAVYGVVVAWPASRQKQAMAADIASKQERLLQERAPALAPLREEVAQLRGELERRRVKLPRGETPYAVLDRLSIAIRENGIGVYEINHRDARVFARFALTPVDVEFECGFPEAFDVVRRIEHMQPPARIERLELVGDADDASGQVTVGLQLSSFFLPVYDNREGGRP